MECQTALKINRRIRIRDALTDFINERESDHLSEKRAEYLDELYLEVDARIQEIQNHLLHKKVAVDSDMKLPLNEQIQSASKHATNKESVDSPSKDISH